MKQLHVFRPSTLFLLVALTAGSAVVEAEDWTRFRGPNGSGVAEGADLPLEMGPGNNEIWETEVPFGRSSPVFAGDRIFLTAIDDGALVTLAVSRKSGEVLWKSALERTHTADLHEATDSSTSTPTTDGENVYAFFHEAGLVSYDADGNQRWHFPMGPFRNFYGMGTSPIVTGKTVLLACDQAQGSFLVAIDKDTGEQLWRQERPGRAESYSTPLLYPNAEKPEQVILLGTKWIDAYDLETGESIWTTSGVGSGPVSSPVLAGDLLFVNAPDHASEPWTPYSSMLSDLDKNGDELVQHSETEGMWLFKHFGFGDVDGDGVISKEDWETLGGLMESDHWGLYAVRVPKGDGEPEILWNNRQAVSYIPTVLHYEDVLYMIKGSILTAFEPTTGEVLKRGRMEKVSKDVYASPVAADGRIYVAGLDGNLVVLSAGPEWEVLAVNDMGEPIHSSPTISHGRLYLRTSSKLYSFGEAASDASAESR
jgi:outer membrane protein assembly factor BamB